jgi:starvation-inducible DNA-binding protein
MKPVIGISDAVRAQVAELLNRLLADECILYTKTKNFHWNVTGPFFTTYHELFRTQYEKIDDFIDDVAERVRTLGFRAAGSFSEFLYLGRISEESNMNHDSKTMILRVLRDHESIIRQIRHDLTLFNQEEINDSGTEDFLISLMAEHEKMAWILRSHIEETY